MDVQDIIFNLISNSVVSNSNMINILGNYLGDYNQNKFAECCCAIWDIKENTNYSNLSSQLGQDIMVNELLSWMSNDDLIDALLTQDLL